MPTQPFGVFTSEQNNALGSSMNACRSGQGKLLMVITGLCAGCHNQALPCSEQDVSGNKTWEECTGGDYCSFSVHKHTLSQTSLLQQHENTASHKEINAILLNSNMYIKPLAADNLWALQRG